MPALACDGVSVSFGSVQALHSVSVAFPKGKIHAVVGQNGAGKTTFARVCAGLIQPAGGGVFVDGTPLPTGNVAAARAAGVELVHQSFALPPSFTVAEAMEFGATSGQLFTRAGLERRWRSHIEELGLNVRPRDRIMDLPIEAQQGVEIARALVLEAQVLILDEPTAVLSVEGAAALFARLRRLRDRGVTIVVILHKIREVMEVAETVSVLRGGRLVESVRPIADIMQEELSAAIIGSAPARAETIPSRRLAGTEVLRLKDVETRHDAAGTGLNGVDMEVASGEIVGIAGVEGNGQRALVGAIAGLVRLSSGEVALAGNVVTHQSPLARRTRGLRVVPFDRNTEGLSQTSELWTNWSVGRLLLAHSLRWLSPGPVKDAARAALQEWGVKFSSVSQPAGSLSGGNAQKVILAREIDAAAIVIIAAQPTRGLDVGATAFVWQALRAAALRGVAVVVVSSDLDELFEIADRILVMSAGRVAGTFSPPYQLERVGAAMTMGSPA